MLEFVDVPIHVRLHRSPPLATRLALAILGSLLTLLVLAPIVARVWERPEPIDASVEVVLGTAPSGTSRRAFAAVVLGLGVVVGISLELLVAGGERLTAEQVILFSEITRVDAVALCVVVAGVFLAGIITLHTRAGGQAVAPRVYRRWLLVSVGYPVVLLWALLVIYDFLGLAGML